jgi:hypothetical protein
MTRGDVYLYNPNGQQDMRMVYLGSYTDEFSENYHIYYCSGQDRRLTYTADPWYFKRHFKKVEEQ